MPPTIDDVLADLAAVDSAAKSQKAAGQVLADRVHKFIADYTAYMGGRPDDEVIAGLTEKLRQSDGDLAAAVARNTGPDAGAP